MPRSAPATTAETTNTIKIGIYSNSGSRHAGYVALGVIGRAHERTGFDVGEAQDASCLPQFGKFVGGVVPGHRQVLGRGPQILPQGEDLDVGGAEITHRLEQLLPLLAEPQDDARLRQEARRGPAGAAEELEGALVTSAVAGQLVQA